ncbi:hypothetical protein KHS76_14090 [Paenibacillus sp. CGMCC 1.18879]|nr:hypothetical protein [Paenibacillus sp. CGMCC 1.18879]
MESLRTVKQGERLIFTIAGKECAGECIEVEKSGVWMVFDDNPEVENFVAYEDKAIFRRESDMPFED